MLRRPRSPKVVGALFIVSMLAACSSSSSTGPALPDVTGQWAGLAGPPINRLSSATLTETGSNVAGTFSVTGAIVNGALTGTIDAAGDFSFQAASTQCQTWSGSDALSANDDTLSGSLRLDDTCNPQNTTTATIQLIRQ